MAKKWPTEDQDELLDALLGLVGPVDGETKAQWIHECEARCAAIDNENDISTGATVCKGASELQQ